MKQQPKKAGNHHVPKMLLKRFASRQKGKSVYVWQFRRDSKRPFEPNILDAGKEVCFYGDPENGIEEDLMSIESEHSRLLDQLLAGESPAQHHQQLRELVWLLVVRTANLRYHFGAIAQAGVDEIAAQADSPLARAAVTEGLHSEFDGQLDAAIEMLPPTLASALTHAFATRPALRDKLRRVMAKQLKHLDIADALRSTLDVMLERTPLADAIKSGHVTAMRKLLDSRLAPDSFNPLQWEVVRVPPHSLILGDGAVVCRGPDGEVGHLLRFGKAWEEVRLPIAHDVVLLGSKSETVTAMSPSELNGASASLAYDAFFASRNSDPEQQLHKRIRTGTAALSSEDVVESVRQLWSN